MEGRPYREVVPLLGRHSTSHGRGRRSHSAEEDDEQMAGGNNGLLDPELNEVLEKLLTPNNTYQSLTLPRTHEPDVGLEEADRFDEDDFDGE